MIVFKAAHPEIDFKTLQLRYKQSVYHSCSCIPSVGLTEVISGEAVAVDCLYDSL